MYLVFISTELTVTRLTTLLVCINILQYAVLCVPYSYFIEDSRMYYIGFHCTVSGILYFMSWSFIAVRKDLFHHL